MEEQRCPNEDCILLISQSIFLLRKSNSDKKRLGRRRLERLESDVQPVGRTEGPCPYSNSPFLLLLFLPLLDLHIRDSESGYHAPPPPPQRDLPSLSLIRERPIKDASSQTHTHHRLLLREDERLVAGSLSTSGKKKKKWPRGKGDLTHGTNYSKCLVTLFQPSIVIYQPSTEKGSEGGQNTASPFYSDRAV